jgi:hypothetical protein
MRARLVISVWKLPLFLVGLGLFGAGTLVPLLKGVLEPSHVAALGKLPMILGGLLAIYGGFRSEKMSPLVDVSLDADALTIGRKPFARTNLRGAVTIPGAQPTLRVLRHRRPSIDLVFERPADTEQLARDLGFAPEQQALELTLPSALPPAMRWLVSFSVIPFIAAALVLPRGSAAVVVAASSLVAMLFLLLWPSRVRVGADGVNYTWLWRRRFVRLAGIEAVQIHPVVQYSENAGDQAHRVLLQLPNGDGVEIKVGSPECAAILRARIEELRRAAGQPPHERDFEAALSRAGRSSAQWVAHLRQLVSSDGYRAEGIARDALVDTAANPNQQPHLRVAAAVAALGPGVEPQARARIAEAARASADPRVRVAMEKLLDEDAASDEAIAEALAEVDAASREASR